KATGAIKRRFKAPYQVKLERVRRGQEKKEAFSRTAGYMVKCPLRFSSVKDVTMTVWAGEGEARHRIRIPTGHKQKFREDMDEDSMRDYLAAIYGLDQKLVRFGSRENSKTV